MSARGMAHPARRSRHGARTELRRAITIAAALFAQGNSSPDHRTNDPVTSPTEKAKKEAAGGQRRRRAQVC